MLLTTLFANVTVTKPTDLPDVSGDQLFGGILNLVFLLAAGISLIVLILQGIRFALSSGNSEATTQARNGIIYALVGLTIITTAWSLIEFTINRVIRSTSTVAETSTLTNLLADIAGLIVFIGAIISIIMILVGAIKFNLSGGNSQQASSARNTIIYAMIGSVITIVAGPIIVYILGRLN